MGDGDDAERDVGADHREVAVREVDDLHDPEHEREPAGEQRVQSAGQDALDDGVDPGHYGSLTSSARSKPKYAASTCSGVTSDGRPSSVVWPSSRHCRRDATRSAWLTSCSTSSTVSPDSRICGIIA